MATLPADSPTVYSLCLKEITAPNGENHIGYNIYIVASCIDKFAITNSCTYT